MGRTFIRQDTQILNSDVYDDTVVPTEAAFETNPTEIETDLNNIRSMLHELRDVRNTNWWSALTAATGFESGSARGVQDVNQDLHELERKRILRKRLNLTDVVVTASQNWEVLDDAAGELPGNTTAAVGAVTTLGTVVASIAGSFDSHQLTEVAGSSAITPKNLVEIVDGTTRDPILTSDGRQIYGLLQSENASDGFTITTTTTDRVQISFVILNATGDDLIACPVSDIAGKTINYCYVERVALDDLTEEDFLRGAVTDTPASATVTRQVAYDNQGTTPVDLTTNAILDLEGAGLEWQIRDDLEALLFRIIEGSAGGTSEIEFGSDVDLFDNNAAVNDFAAGATIRSGGARPIAVGVSDGVVESTAGDLEVQAAAELLLDDGNRGASTFSVPLKVTEDAAEWSTLETLYGEVSLASMLAQAKKAENRTKGVAVVTGASNPADTNMTGAGGTPNLDAQLPAYDHVASFVTDVDVYLNGVLMRNGADATANHDVYPGTTPANGDLKFEFEVKSTGSKPDVITMIVYGEP